ncbi:MAG: 50S ribosomal protein L15 [Candidatus Buchananbacteria bacterium RBG_13_36_9]|uniref:Large ribosomal subunit protein uL15 n=1 Tax=Candidatus Buchananbacteria bacterium RBG_13_36_9 TaxID=1797530 RepID=A0A1G1XMP4_9BACT|nr:MAG: 50S ribosomal protein L15 [Candidatus Buchananbacteria bacterium RBG_13_36_9]
MALRLHNLRPAFGSKHKKKRIGRGHGSGHGTYSTRGAKGQRARTGGSGGLKLKGMKANIQSIPKLGGFRSLKPKLRVINLEDLENKFENNDIITVGKLVEKGLIKSSRPGVKVLGMGKITKKFILKVDKISDSAKEAIEKAGGKVILLSGAKAKIENQDKK